MGQESLWRNGDMSLPLGKIRPWGYVYSCVSFRVLSSPVYDTVLALRLVEVK